MSPIPWGIEYIFVLIRLCPILASGRFAGARVVQPTQPPSSVANLQAYPSPPAAVEPQFANMADVLPIEPHGSFSGSLSGAKPVTPPRSPWCPETALTLADATEIQPTQINIQTINKLAQLSGSMLFPYNAGQFALDVDGNLYPQPCDIPALFLAPPALLNPAYGPEEDGDAEFVDDGAANYLPMTRPASDLMPMRSVNPGVPSRAASEGTIPGNAASFGGMQSRGSSGSVQVVPILLDLARRTGVWTGQDAGQDNAVLAPEFPSIVNVQEMEEDAQEASEEEEEQVTPLAGIDPSDDEFSEGSEDNFEPRRRSGTRRLAAASRNNKRPARSAAAKRSYAEPAAEPARKKPRQSGASSSSGQPTTNADGSELISPRVLNTAAQSLFGKSGDELTPSQRSQVVNHILSKRERNTESARKSRERRKSHLEGMEHRINELEEENERLKKRVRELEGRLGEGGSGGGRRR